MRNPEKTGLVFETVALTSKTVRTSGKWESQITNTENQGNQFFDLRTPVLRSRRSRLRISVRERGGATLLENGVQHAVALLVFA